eukprot:GHVU01042042.1.p1 GENE.GHVU01042042.1~~GHVU01042042.1.p1  ORF type:complete len:109 (-),score=4.33 GHVU01042042.1:40-366(-)
MRLEAQDVDGPQEPGGDSRSQSLLAIPSIHQRPCRLGLNHLLHASTGATAYRMGSLAVQLASRKGMSEAEPHALTEALLSSLTCTRRSASAPRGVLWESMPLTVLRKI